MSVTLFYILMYHDDKIWYSKYLSKLPPDFVGREALNGHSVLQSNQRYTPHDLNQSCKLIRFSDLTMPDNNVMCE